MNKKHFVYSFQYLAVLLSLFTFTACEKDEFTAEDALALEEQRARLQAELDEAAKDAEVERMKDLQKWAHTIDSLNAANAGGLVFYSVSVVPGGSTAFANGRYEEVGVNNVTVTASQYGMEQSATTNNGIAVFPEPFRSGEVTVTVDSDVQGYTSAHYTSNLTPDGGVPNDATVFVNNIIPVFENDPAVHGEEDMAMISGAAFAELNILDGNNVEENAPQGTAFTAVIDTRPGYGFWNEYIAEANGADEGGNGNVNGGTTRSGAIQMIRYENASTRALVEADGSYSMMTAATASGLPLRLNYSEFIADREYFQDGFSTNNTGGAGALDDTDFGVVAKRTLYGPNVTPTAYPTYTFTTANATVADVSLRERDAVIQASITSTGAVETVSAGGYDWLVLHPDATGSNNGPFAFGGAGVVDPAGDVATTLMSGLNLPNEAYAGLAPGSTGYNSVIRPGAYLADGNVAADAGPVDAPTVAFSASPTGDPADNVTGFVVLSNIEDEDVTAQGGTTDNNGAVSQLRHIVGIVITNKGAGYDENNPVTVTVSSYKNTDVTGTGSIQSPSNSLTYVRVIDGGYGFLDTQISVNTIGRWTGFDPYPVIPSTVTGASPVGLLEFEYDWEQSGATAVGTVQSIGIVGSAGTWTAVELAQLNANPFQYFVRQIGFTGAAIQDADGDEIFNIVGGSLEGNPDWGTGGSGAYAGAGTGTSVAGDDGNGVWNTANTTYMVDPNDVPSGLAIGQGYVFVPEISVTGGTAAAGQTITNAAISVWIDGEGPSSDTPTDGSAGNTVEDYHSVAGGLLTEPNFSAWHGATNTYAGAAAAGSLLAFRITSPGSGYASIDDISIVAIEPVNSLDAEFFTGGSSIDNYAIDGTGTGNIIGGAPWDVLITNADADLVPANNAYTVEFSAPADPNGSAAVGVANFDDDLGSPLDFGNTDSRRVFGVEIIDAGVGYDPTQTVTWELVPTDGSDANIVAYLEADDLTFTLTDGGLGYALRPDVYVTGGGVNLDDVDAVNPDDFEFRFDNNGTIISMTFTDNTNGAYTAANAAVDPINVVLSLDEQEELMNHWWNGTSNFNGFSFTNGNPVPDGDVTYGSNCDAITSVSFEIFDGAGFVQGVEEFHQDVADHGNANGVPFISGTEANGSAADEYGLGGGFIVPPTVTFSSPFGTGFTMEYVLKPENGLVDDVVITNGGTGFFCVPTNDPSMNPNGEPFRVLGGPDGSTVDADGDGMMDPFEVFSGLQYVRDVHYGTGEVLE